MKNIQKHRNYEITVSIYEAHSEVPDYNRPRIHLFWAQNRLSKTKSLQLNTHEAFLCLWMIFLEHEHHNIPEFCLSTTSGNHTINYVCNRNILSQPGKMFPCLIWTKCHQITLAQWLSLSPHKSSHDLSRIQDVDEPFWKGYIEAGLQNNF